MINNSNIYRLFIKLKINIDKLIFKFKFSHLSISIIHPKKLLIDPTIPPLCCFLSNPPNLFLNTDFLFYCEPPLSSCLAIIPPPRTGLATFLVSAPMIVCLYYVLIAYGVIVYVWFCKQLCFIAIFND